MFSLSLGISSRMIVITICVGCIGAYVFSEWQRNAAKDKPTEVDIQMGLKNQVNAELLKKSKNKVPTTAAVGAAAGRGSGAGAGEASVDQDDPAIKIQCAFCYLKMTKKVTSCAKCQQRQYCSAKCKDADADMHGLWCNSTAELNVDYEIRDAGNGKGMGMFAMRPFSVGDKILAERFVLHIQELSDVQANDMPEVVKQFSALPTQIQAAVTGLHPQVIDNTNDMIFCKRFGPGAIQFKYNCIALGADPPIGGAVFITSSRLNHACLPNCSRYYLADQKLCIISADADIAAGEEMTISYSNEFFETAEEQAEHLLAGWGISCTCLACSDTSLCKKLFEVNKMDKEIYELSQSDCEPEAYLVGEKLINTLNEIKRAGGPNCSMMRSRTYNDMFNVAVSRTNPTSTLNEARRSMVRNLENKEHYMAGSTPEPAELIRTRRLYDRIMS